MLSGVLILGVRDIVGDIPFIYLYGVVTPTPRLILLTANTPIIPPIGLQTIFRYAK